MHSGSENKLEYVRALLTTRLSCSKTLLELTTYDGTAIWWMVNSMFNAVMNTEEYFPVRTAKNLTILYKIAGPLAQLTYDFLLATATRSLFILTGKRKENKDKSIAFMTSNVDWGSIINIETKDYKKGDRIFDALIKRVRRQSYSILSFNPVSVEPVRGIRILSEKLQKWDIPHVPAELFLNVDVYKKYLAARKYYKGAINILRHDPEFRRLCVRNGRDEYNKVMTHLDFYFVFMFPFLVRERELAKRWIKYERPLAIVMMNEYGYMERTYLVAAKLEGVQVVAVQHGMISPTHPGYMYEKDAISAGSVESPHCPLPDKTAVSGDYFFDLLTKTSSYTEAMVAVTGQPRYDVLFHAARLYSKKQLTEKYRINPNHKVILWATQCHGFSDEENESNFTAVLNAMREINDVTLLIKQHPGEPAGMTRWSWNT